jgi:hypothetical protein
MVRHAPEIKIGSPAKIHDRGSRCAARRRMSGQNQASQPTADSTLSCPALLIAPGAGASSQGWKSGPPGGSPAVILDLTAFLLMTSQTNSLYRPQKAPSTLAAWALLAAIFAAVQFASLFTPPLLDDADASHAQAAQQMAESGDLGDAEDQRHPLPGEAAAALLARRRALSRLRPERLCHPPAQCAGAAGLRLAGLALGGAAPGDAAPASTPLLGVLTSIGPFLLHSLCHSRGPAQLSAAALPSTAC